ncbi:MAG: S-layer homology domain-containing protein [Candidatus Peribacteraceae bacterium]|nr:S-layer homology domain-containing protein [Candidatus Peribacteraceae bacterium]
MKNYLLSLAVVTAALIPLSVSAAEISCSNLFWFDTAGGDQCQTRKQFCGTYMYLGLQTFSNQQDCLNAFNTTKASCTPSWKCDWGACSNGWQSLTANDSNHCGVANGSIACPALARQCSSSSQCKTDTDCPQIACLVAPCPTNTCVDGKCVKSLVPSISSVSPNPAKIGSTVTVNGFNLRGFEGDKNLWIENGAGQKGVVLGDSTDSTTVVTFKLSGSYCTKDTSYSGLPCPSSITITPGAYHLYAQPWGTMSNKVAFSVVASPADPTAGWKTYSNTQYGYEVKYPNNWKGPISDTNVAFMPVGGQDYSLAIHVYNVPLNEAEALLPVFSRPGRTIDSRTTITTNGIHWVKLIVAKNQIVQLTYHDGKTYAAQYSTFENVSPQILSTFKFTTPSAVFTVPELGIQFPIPSDLSDLVYVIVDAPDKETDGKTIGKNVLFSTKALIQADQDAGGHYCTAEQDGIGIIHVDALHQITSIHSQSACSENVTVQNLQIHLSSLLTQAVKSATFTSASNGKIPPAGYEDTVLTNIETYRNPFPDTDMTQLSGKAAAELYRRAIIGGFPDGQFKGDQPVNRAEAAKFLLLARYGSVDDIANSGTFPDVLDGQWYTKFVMTAAQKGIINGYPDGTFRPADQVNTAEFLKMLALTFGLQLNTSNTYSDVSANAWFARYAGIAKKYSLFPGRSASLRPGSVLSRQDVAVAIYQYLSSR